jgi:hypothetical protein
LKKVEKEGLPVPVIADVGDAYYKNEVLRVRKIELPSSNNAEIPHPSLLLAKAVSNFLKQQDAELFPGCGEISDDEVHVILESLLLSGDNTSKSLLLSSEQQNPNHFGYEGSIMQPKWRLAPEEITCTTNNADDDSDVTCDDFLWGD